MSPELVEDFVSHSDRLRRPGQPAAPDAYVLPRAAVAPARRRDRPRRGGGGLRAADEHPRPAAASHTLRRTYTSIALLANRFDVLWVMGQRRRRLEDDDGRRRRAAAARKRHHRTAFDRLVGHACEQLHGTEPPASTGRQARRLEATE
jgi:hypothetical protein